MNVFSYTFFLETVIKTTCERRDIAVSIMTASPLAKGRRRKKISFLNHLGKNFQGFADFRTFFRNTVLYVHTGEP